MKQNTKTIFNFSLLLMFGVSLLVCSIFQLPKSISPIGIKISNINPSSATLALQVNYNASIGNQSTGDARSLKRLQ